MRGSVQRNRWTAMMMTSLPRSTSARTVTQPTTTMAEAGSMLEKLLAAKGVGNEAYKTKDYDTAIKEYAVAVKLLPPLPEEDDSDDEETRGMQAAVSAADHQDPFDRVGTAQRWMHQSLVVVAFLLLCCHPAAIQQQAPSIALTANHADSLERTGLFDQHLSF